MKLSKIILLFLCLGLINLISSCSGDRGNEAPPTQGTSQVKLNVNVEGESPITSNLGYNVNINSGTLYFRNINIIADESNEEEESGHEHSVDNSMVSKCGETVNSDVSNLVISGLFSINLLRKSTDMGFYNGNPGTYSKLSFMIHPPVSHNEHTTNKHEDENNKYSVIMSGQVSKDKFKYPLYINLPIEQSITKENLSLVLTTGNYRRVSILFGLEHWFEDVDFSKAQIKDDSIYIDNNNNKLLMDKLNENITEHIQVIVHDI